jgi:hypothetical protein
MISGMPFVFNKHFGLKQMFFPELLELLREKLQNFQKGNIPRGYLAYFHDLFMQKRASAE